MRPREHVRFGEACGLQERRDAGGGVGEAAYIAARAQPQYAQAGGRDGRGAVHAQQKPHGAQRKRPAGRRPGGEAAWRGRLAGFARAPARSLPAHGERRLRRARAAVGAGRGHRQRLPRHDRVFGAGRGRRAAGRSAGRDVLLRGADFRASAPGGGGSALRQRKALLSAAHEPPAGGGGGAAPCGFERRDYAAPAQPGLLDQDAREPSGYLLPGAAGGLRLWRAHPREQPASLYHRPRPAALRGDGGARGRAHIRPRHERGLFRGLSQRRQKAPRRRAEGHRGVCEVSSPTAPAA